MCRICALPALGLGARCPRHATGSVCLPLGLRKDRPRSGRNGLRETTLLHRPIAQPPGPRWTALPKLPIPQPRCAAIARNLPSTFAASWYQSPMLRIDKIAVTICNRVFAFTAASAISFVCSCYLMASMTNVPLIPCVVQVPVISEPLRFSSPWY